MEKIGKLEDYLADAGTAGDPLKTYYLRMLGRLSAADRGAYGLIDMSVPAYCFTAPGSEFRDLAGSVGNIADGDLELMLDSWFRVLDFLAEIPVQERTDYKLEQDFRIKCSSGALSRLSQQLIPLELDDCGRIWLVLVITEESGITDTELPVRRSLVHMESGARLLFPEKDYRVKPLLSPRENEILGYIARGYHSRDIANFLDLSVATVNNHRQRILSKTGTANTAEAVGMFGDMQRS